MKPVLFQSVQLHLLRCQCVVTHIDTHCIHLNPYASIALLLLQDCKGSRTTGKLQCNSKVASLSCSFSSGLTAILCSEKRNKSLLKSLYFTGLCSRIMHLLLSHILTTKHPSTTLTIVLVHVKLLPLLQCAKRWSISMLSTITLGPIETKSGSHSTLFNKNVNLWASSQIHLCQHSSFAFAKQVFMQPAMWWIMQKREQDSSWIF